MRKESKLKDKQVNIYKSQLGELRKYFSNHPFSVKNISNHWWQVEDLCSQLTDYLYQKNHNYKQSHQVWNGMLRDEKQQHIETAGDFYEDLKKHKGINKHNKESLSYFSKKTFIQIQSNRISGIIPESAVFVIERMLTRIENIRI